jgi:hypothetical protein
MYRFVRLMSRFAIIVVILVPIVCFASQKGEVGTGVTKESALSPEGQLADINFQYIVETMKIQSKANASYMLALSEAMDYQRNCIYVLILLNVVNLGLLGVLMKKK